MGVLQQRSWGRGSAKALGELGLGSLVVGGVLGPRSAREAGEQGPWEGWSCGSSKAAGWPGQGNAKAAGVQAQQECKGSRSVRAAGAQGQKEHDGSGSTRIGSTKEAGALKKW